MTTPVVAVPERAGQDVMVATVAKLLDVMRRGERPSWELTFAVEACLAAARGSCRRAGVGAVFIRDKRVVCKGYNGSIVGEPTCFEEGCDMRDGSCQRTLHAEHNGVADAAARGVSLRGTSVVVTHAPCYGCTKMLLNVGVARVEYLVAYRVDERVVDAFARANVPLVKLEV